MKKQKVIGYLRISTDRQDLVNQKQQVLEFAQRNELLVNEFIEVEMSTRKSNRHRKIDLLKESLNENDILITVELSRLGRNMIETLNLINELNERNIHIMFIRQPELSTNTAHSKLLLAIYSYLAESERDYISMRVKDALRIAKLNGIQLGRPKGSRNSKVSIFDTYKEEIDKYFEMKLSKKAILTLINSKVEKKMSRGAFQYWMKQNYA